MLLLTVGMAAFSAMYESCALMGMIDMYESLCSLKFYFHYSYSGSPPTVWGLFQGEGSGSDS